MSTIRYLGIDVGIQRGCAYAGLDEDACMVASGWFTEDLPADLLESLQAAEQPVHIGIDAPRQPVDPPRAWYWNGATQSWRPRKTERGAGRHCEVVVKALGLGNPQWTPLITDPIPEWIRLGFALFEQLSALKTTVVHEVFPTASYRQFSGQDSPQAHINLASFQPGPKDLLDACVAALTVRELALGRGTELGGGDGLGTIVIPGSVKLESELSRWPFEH